MSTIQPIDFDETSEKHYKLKKYLKRIIIIACAITAYVYYTSKVVKIPDDVYATRENSYFKDLFSTPYRKVIWFGANCPMSKLRKDIIDKMMKNYQLDKYYLHQPFLQDSLMIQPGDELGYFILKNCNRNICIVAPEFHKVIQTDEKHLLRDLNKYLIKNP